MFLLCLPSHLKQQLSNPFTVANSHYEPRPVDKTLCRELFRETWFCKTFVLCCDWFKRDTVLYNGFISYLGSSRNSVVLHPRPPFIHRPFVLQQESFERMLQNESKLNEQKANDLLKEEKQRHKVRRVCHLQIKYTLSNSQLWQFLFLMML